MKLKAKIAIALVTTLAVQTVALPSRSQAAPAFVQSCLSNAYCTAAVLVIGGISYWQLNWGDSTDYYSYTEDPEADSDEWFDYIWADNPAQAVQKCQRYADQNGLIYVKVRRTSRSGTRYECHVKSYA